MKKTWVRFLGMLLALLMALGCTAAFAEGDDFSGTVTISLYSAKGVQKHGKPLARRTPRSTRM